MSVQFVRDLSRRSAFALPTAAAPVTATALRNLSSRNFRDECAYNKHAAPARLWRSASHLQIPSRRIAHRRGITSTSKTMAALNTIKSNCRKVICIGRNYADHVKELNNQRPKQPFFFLKPPSSILLPNEGPVLRPRGVSTHFEVELGLLIGKTIRDLDENDEAGWMDAIDQYLLTIDMTGRNVQEEAKKRGLPWDIAKGFDTFLPVAGPIDKSKIKDPHDIELWLSVNGQIKQSDSTELMLFRIGRQLSDISKVMTLEKGDIVLTGTPKGVGPVVTGDVMEAGIRVDGNEVEEARIKVDVRDRESAYEYTETY